MIILYINNEFLNAVSEEILKYPHNEKYKKGGNLLFNCVLYEVAVLM